MSFTLVTYLFTLVKNHCLNFLRHQLVEENYTSLMKQELQFKLNALETFNYSCPSVMSCRRSFSRHWTACRNDVGRYSVNTVENQMGIALKRLRIALIDYLPLVLLLID